MLTVPKDNGFYGIQGTVYSFPEKGEVTMAIIINLDVMMAKRKVGLTELAKEVDITLANLSILKNNKAKAVRLSTLDAICKALQCQPGDILEYVESEGASDGEKSE